MKSWVQGYVQVDILCKDSARVIQKLLQQECQFWEVKTKSDSHMHSSFRISCKMRVADVFLLRTSLRGLSCRIRIHNRKGLPFYREKLFRRKIFIVSGIVVICALCLCSMMVWKIQVIGNHQIQIEDVLQAAAKQGIVRFQWKFRLASSEQLAKQIQLQLPQTSWVGVFIQGTQVTIQIVESALAEKQNLQSPSHLVASKNAVVSDIVTLQGIAQVKPHTYVRKGDILISGWIGEAPNIQSVIAKGQVKGIVWYQAEIESPLHTSYAIYTGNERKRYYVAWGRHALRVYGGNDIPFPHYVTIPQQKLAQWGRFRFPVSWLTETIRESQHFHQEIDLKTAKQLGLDFAKEKLYRQLDGQAQVIRENILHEKTENGKVYMKVLLEVEELITQIQPIVVQGD